MIVQSTLHHQVGALREALTALMETSTQQDPSPRRPAEALGDPPFGDDAFSERCRLALHRLIGLSTEGVIMVSSPQRKEGRSSVAAAMAGALAHARGTGPVLLLDLDFRRSGLADIFSVAPTPGLADYLEGREDLRAVSREPSSQLWLIPAGNHLGDPARLIHQIAEPGLLSIFREYFDWVVVDVPPTLDHPEVTALAPLADWHVVVGRHRRTLLAELTKVRLALGDGESGFLLTGDSTRIPKWLRRLL